jgi:beta-phosphoglucomutase-like phosphatase (HAD superfamily)
LIETAIARGFRCAIASATPEADIRHYTDRLGISAMFQAIVSSDSVPRPKPAPDVYLRAAEMARSDPQHCIVVEDTPVGLAAGRAAGMRCVAFPNQWTETFDMSGADLTVLELNTPAILRILHLVD